MKIKRIQTMDFKGLHGKRCYDFPDKVCLLVGGNGTGKSSLIQAIRFGLTGEFTGIPIYSGKDRCAVQIDIEDEFGGALSVIRQIQSNGKKTCWVNGAKTTITATNAAISQLTRIPDGVLRVMSASDIVGSLAPGDFTDLLLKNMPESLNAETIATKANATEGVRALIYGFFKDKNFSTEDLDKFYSHAYNLRKETRKRRDMKLGELRSFGNCVQPNITREEILAIKANAQEAMRKNTERLSAIANYDAAVALRRQQEASIASLEQQLSVMPLPAQENDMTTEKIQEWITGAQEQMRNLSMQEGTLSANEQNFAKILSSLEGDGCPLAVGLVCTTDKTSLKEKITTDMQNAQRQLAEIKTKKEQLQKGIEERTILQKQMLEVKRQIDARASLQQRIDTLRSQMVQVPEKPSAEQIPVDIRATNADMILQDIDRYEKCVRVKQEAEVLERQLADLETVVSAFAPRGVVKQSIVSDYLSSCGEIATQSVAGVYQDTRVVFLDQGGIVPYLDRRGNGTLLNYSALSGGEKAVLTFLLLILLNRMTGLGILIMDEISVLDAQGFYAMLQMAKNSEANQVILAGVDHGDFMTVASQENIPVLAP